MKILPYFCLKINSFYKIFEVRYNSKYNRMSNMEREKLKFLIKLKGAENGKQVSIKGCPYY